MLIEEFDFELPEEQIAKTFSIRRDGSRMLHLERGSCNIADRVFGDLEELLGPCDLLVLNNTRVFPARLLGRTETGASVEVLLEEEIAEDKWSALAKPAKRLKPRKDLVFEDSLKCTVIGRTSEGRVVLQFDPNIDFWKEIERVGKTPLPHYIERNDGESADDRERYQTVYAERRGAIAAPTAGLHFTNEILERLRAKGVQIVEITLHVGYGTFEPVRVVDLTEHKVLPERIEVSEEAAKALNQARREGRRIVAVGTTTTRALESCVDADGVFGASTLRTSLTVAPGYKFKAVNALLTNFHLPKSSLLVLVSTFGGHELIMKAYKHAVDSGYRFYSYGDCMFIE